MGLFGKLFSGAASSATQTAGASHGSSRAPKMPRLPAVVEQIAADWATVEQVSASQQSAGVYVRGDSQTIYLRSRVAQFPGAQQVLAGIDAEIKGEGRGDVRDAVVVPNGSGGAWVLFHGHYVGTLAEPDDWKFWLSALSRTGKVLVVRGEILGGEPDRQNFGCFVKGSAPTKKQLGV